MLCTENMKKHTFFYPTNTFTVLTPEAFEYLTSKPGTMLSRQCHSVVTWRTEKSRAVQMVNPKIGV